MSSIIQFRGRSGEVRTVDAAVGETVMRTALANDVPGIIGECGGELSCATCHVVVASEWFDRLDPVTGDEEDMLEVVGERTDLSRLSCQIVVSPETDGLTVEVPEG